MFVKYYKMPEWIAKLIEDSADKVLDKTKSFNPSADVWRPIRPEDMGLPEGTYAFTIPAGANNVISFTVPAGQGFGFIGYTIVGDLGAGSWIRLKVNGVKRQEVAGQLAVDNLIVLPEELVYAKQNDRVEIEVNNTTGNSVDLTFFPLGVVAGEKKTLLVG